MALGVLNNLSAMFAENNLNNTQNSLNTTLQQLSSGSKINSGADDAAGLSLVDGLGANSAALSQSSVNATEGVGLLQVADGALSQVTSLLNRAVTLATEASNGTLNTSQTAAADQEYQSILSEIDNIGTTTTYNQEQVFGSNVSIYTGDSSSAGSSIDALSIGSLSSSTVGQTDGTMGYYTTNNNTDFIDVGATTAAAAGTTALVDAGTLAFNYQTSSGQTATATFTINAGVAGDGYSIAYTSTAAGATTASDPVTVFTSSSAAAPTVNDLIGAINGSGLGITATLTDTTGAGDTATTANAVAGDYGIELTGNISSAAPTSAGQVQATATGLVAAQQFDSYASSSSTATISYSGIAGEDLSGSDLLNSTDARSALTAINAAISDVASQDGYVGAQINTLNSVSSVESTQQENIVSAQNAVQATDYAAATSNLSKYEILTQTGISALAQANSVEQEVTKLLQ